MTLAKFQTCSDCGVETKNLRSHKRLKHELKACPSCWVVRSDRDWHAAVHARGCDTHNGALRNCTRAGLQHAALTLLAA